jgi:pre-mRNA-splicing factor CDC5/CEF1
MGEAANLRARESENDATRGLVNTYSTLNAGTPIRTPKAPEQEDHIANEIRNIRALNDTNSALLGGENTPLHEGTSSTGFDGITPRKQTISTPNPMATPLRADGVGATPGRPGQTPMRTPRDTLSLNQDGGMSMVSATPRDLRLRDLAVRNQVKSGLASLPKPKDTEWEFDIPDEEKELMEVDEMTEEDAAERDRRERERREAEEALEFRRRTQVMQKNLPRPVRVDLPSLLKQASSITDVAESLIAKESANLMANDAMRYPVPGGQVNGSPKPLQLIDDDALAEARLLIMSETKPLPKFEDVQAAFEARASSSLLLGLGCYNDDDEEEQGAVMKQAFDVS